MKQITFRLQAGDDLKQALAEKTRDVSAGVLLSIVGGLERASLRMAGSEPNNQIVKDWEGPFEIVSGTGTFSQDGIHVHVSLAHQDGNVIGGHLKGGCIVKTTAEIIVGVFEGVSYRRVHDSVTGFPELEVG